MTNFFCLSYALVNLSAFVLRITGAPNFRPRFKACTWQISLMGGLLCLGIMFYLSWPSRWMTSLTRRKALVSVLCLIVVFIYLSFTTPRQEWGDITQSLFYHTVRKLLLKLDSDKNHPKYWRPSVLLYAPTPETYPLVDFCNVMKKGGLYVVATCYENDFRGDCDEFYTIENMWSFFINHVSFRPLSHAVPRQGLPRRLFRALRLRGAPQHRRHLRTRRAATQHHRHPPRDHAAPRAQQQRRDPPHAPRHAEHRAALRLRRRTLLALPRSRCRARSRRRSSAP